MKDISGASLNDIYFRKHYREVLNDRATIAQLEMLDLPDSCICLEVGAGYGSIATWLARRVSPKGRVIATEMSKDCLEVLHAMNVQEGFEVVHHDIVHDEIKERFNLIHARFVLEHIPERDQTVSRLIQIMQPEAWLVLEDALFSTVDEQGSALYQRVMHALATAASHQGSDFFWAKNLGHVLNERGLERVEVNGRVEIFRGGTTTASFWASNLRQKRDTLAKFELSTCEEVDKAIQELLSSNEWFSSPMVVTAIGRKIR